jgi:uncharacterized protein YdaU (DUF1376 family)
MNYYPFHIGDYLSATRHLSWEEDAAFRRLLDTYYTTEKPLPAELRAVCRLVLATTESQREAVEQVLKEFFELTELGWVNRRADAEIAEMQERQQIAKAKANKRWDKHRAERSNASAMPQHDENDATASKGDANAMLPTPTPTPTPTPKVINTKPPAIAAPVGVTDSVWNDFVQLRKDKKAKLTQTAIDGIQAEAAKAGWSLESALRESCARGWVSFKADWVAEKASPNKQQALEQRNRNVAQQWANGGMLPGAI